jgi:hypothetical protein
VLSLSFVAGIICALAALVLLLPWLRTIPGLASLPVLPWQAGMIALVSLATVLALSQNLIHSKQLLAADGPADAAPASTRPAGGTEQAWGDVAAAATQGLGAIGVAGAKSGSGAESMDAAIASLQARLAKDGGSADDWELLAKSYDFEGRPEAASKARSHLIPVASMPESAAKDFSGAASATAPVVVSGEVTLAPSLHARAPSGATLFIIARSLDSPGAPVAVVRGTVGSWPQTFTLDDSHAMLPARKLSSVGRVTIEARVSQNGQALAARGDLQGSSPAINPRAGGVVKIAIDKVVP